MKDFDVIVGIIIGVLVSDVLVLTMIYFKLDDILKFLKKRFL